MSGFIGYLSKKKIDVNLDIPTNNNRNTQSRYTFDNFTVCIQNNNHFQNDSLLIDGDEFFFCLVGVVLNTKEIIQKYCCSNLSDYVIKYVVNQGGVGIKDIKGSYSGFWYNKHSREIKIFNNHFSTKSVYYYSDADHNVFIFSTSIPAIIDTLKGMKLKMSLSVLAAYQMLNYGHMLSDFTLVENIRKLLPATVMTCDYNHRVSTVEYYEYDNTSYLTDKKEDIIYNMYSLLKQSVNLGLEKDREYDYDSLILLSGGLDTRMITFLANELNINNVTNLSFGESFCDDVRIANIIAHKLNNKFIFSSLDGGEFLKKIDENLKLNFGGIQYISSAHTYSAISSFNFDKYGLVFNGNLADISHGDYVAAPYHTYPDSSSLRFSNNYFFYNKIADEVDTIIKKYRNEEHFLVYNRGINGILSGGIMYSDFTETYEVFLYPDLVDYASKMPPKYKYNESLFIECLNKYFPEAAKIKWARWDMNPKVRYNNHFYNYFIRCKKKCKIILRLYTGDMNPFDEWILSNESLSSYFDLIYEDLLDLIENNELKRDLMDVYSKNGARFIQKSRVITILKINQYILS